MASPTIEPKTALVTGGTRGLGRALTIELRDQGWQVFCVVRTAERIPEQVTAIVGDVTHESTHHELSELFATRSLDLLVNNAGSYAGTHRPSEVNRLTMEEMLSIHAVAPAAILTAVLPALRASPKPRVINISSRLGSLAAAADGRFAHLEQAIEYRVGKAAMNMVTLAFSEALGDESIEVCSVHPGRLRTPMGASDAETEPSVAASWLVNWLESEDSISGRFIDLATSQDLPW